VRLGGGASQVLPELRMDLSTQQIGHCPLPTRAPHPRGVAAGTGYLSAANAVCSFLASPAPFAILHAGENTVPTP
jgi:hypothetical protein